jgi:hypothetical protein
MYKARLIKYSFRSDEASWKASSELMLQVATHGEKTGFEVPSLIIGTKDDLKSVELSIQDSNRVFSLTCLLICMIIYINILLNIEWLDTEIFNAVK